MNFLIALTKEATEAATSTASSAASSGFSWATVQQYLFPALMIIGLVLVFWLLIIRPQKKQEKETQKYMKENKVEGNILNVGSSSCLRPATSAYTLSKWGIRGLTLGLAKSLAPYGITVNGIAPGPTATPMLLEDSQSNITNNSNPIGRYVLPEEIANMAVVLVSSMGRTIVGDMIYMTGGAGIITYDDINYSF